MSDDTSSHPTSTDIEIFTFVFKANAQKATEAVEADRTTATASEFHSAPSKDSCQADCRMIKTNTELEIYKYKPSDFISSDRNIITFKDKISLNILRRHFDNFGSHY
ncbi:hypothetical protein CVS40_4199 [Lucilia cuprina]|nr:hypothetical protein CVS40_4199 [Lucilia cuprina]